MDPIGFIIVCIALYGLAQRTPALVGEAVAEFQAARHGETTQASQDRRQRLIDAGVDPATGGAFRQFAGNAWRDFWVDQDRDRQARREQRFHEPDADTGSWWSHLRDRLDEAVTARADQWRSRPDRPGADRAPHPGGDEPAETFDTPEPEPTADAPTADEPRPRPETDRPPIRVAATVGEPQPSRTATAVLELEGEPMSNSVATRGQAVTGVVSGAAEARSIQRALAAATAEYAAAVAAARQRIHSLGEQTISTVQMAGRSTVVAATAQAAEAIAAAQAGVNACSAEVIPLMGIVAREFDKRNS